MVKLSLALEHDTLPTVKVGTTVKLEEIMFPVEFVVVNGKIVFVPVRVGNPMAGLV
jgi:hypothetical protein